MLYIFLRNACPFIKRNYTTQLDYDFHFVKKYNIPHTCLTMQQRSIQSSVRCIARIMQTTCDAIDLTKCFFHEIIQKKNIINNLTIKFPLKEWTDI